MYYIINIIFIYNEYYNESYMFMFLQYKNLFFISDL